MLNFGSLFALGTVAGVDLVLISDLFQLQEADLLLQTSVSFKNWMLHRFRFRSVFKSLVRFRSSYKIISCRLGLRKKRGNLMEIGSASLGQLSQQDVDIKMIFQADVYLGTKKFKSLMERYVLKKSNDSVYSFNIGKTWKKLQLVPPVNIAVENSQDIIFQAGRSVERVPAFHQLFLNHSRDRPEEQLLVNDVGTSPMRLKSGDLSVCFKERAIGYFSSLWERSLLSPSSNTERIFPLSPYSSFTEETFGVQPQNLPLLVDTVLECLNTHLLSNSTKLEPTFQSDSITNVLMHRSDETHCDFFEIFQVFQDLKMCFITFLVFCFICISWIMLFNRRVFELVAIVCSSEV